MLVSQFWVEQNANQALKVANHGYVMKNGRLVMEDSATSLLNEGYLGM